MKNIALLNSLYNFLIEVNLDQSDNDVLAEAQADSDIAQMMMFIRQQNTKAKAILNRKRLEEAEIFLDNLTSTQENDILNSIEDIREREVFVAFFRNYQGASNNDKKSMIQDIKLLEILKKIIK
jgi:hypothetical protein